MKFFIERLYFLNRAPFEALDIDLKENDVAILTAANGRGKTTIITHIVDALHELAKKKYSYEFRGKEDMFYRVVSTLNNLDSQKSSIFYMRTNVGGHTIDYLDIIGSMSEEEYSEIPIENKIPYGEFGNNLNKAGSIKHTKADEDKISSIFDLNLATYFPSYRFENPGYINSTYDVKLSFAVENSFKGSMKNPIEVISGLPTFANWLMDIVLDMQYDNKNANPIFQHLNRVISLTLSGKKNTPLRFGIGPRGYGRTRIQIVDTGTGSTIYPTIFSLSSGEAAALCMFGEIIRQADVIRNNTPLPSIQGVVLIDEIDKHLHIKLQKEILPVLIALFPNVQFLISSHSPFFSIGLADTIKERSKIIDLDNFGIYRDPTSNDLYSEVYEMMTEENSRFKDLYQDLKKKADASEAPLIVTEGKTDVRHIRKAQQALGIDINLEYFDTPGDWGDSKLKQLLEQLSKIPQKKQIIGVFDRDVQKIVTEIESEGQPFKSYGNNVFAFCLPTPKERMDYENISIEFYYSDKDLKKEKNGKRLYFDNEVAILSSAHDRSKTDIIKRESPIETEESTKKIFDLNAGSVEWMHSKAKFSELITSDDEFCRDISFENFKLIFDRINEILK